jgi:hypothetical protein
MKNATKIIIEVPRHILRDMSELFEKKVLYREEGLQGNCKLNMDFLLAQIFHPYSSLVAERRLELRMIGLRKESFTGQQVPHLEFIEMDGADPAQNDHPSARSNRADTTAEDIKDLGPVLERLYGKVSARSNRADVTAEDIKDLGSVLKKLRGKGRAPGQQARARRQASKG